MPGKKTPLKTPLKTAGGFGLLLIILVPVAGGLIGEALITDREWFESLTHPSWRIPNWVFPPVFTVIYVLMGNAAYLVWNRGRGILRRAIPLALCVIQMLLLWIWTPLFFMWESLLGAMIVASLHWPLLVVTMVLFFPVSLKACSMLIPQLIWASVIVALNIHYYFININ